MTKNQPPYSPALSMMSLSEIRQHAPGRLSIQQTATILGISLATFHRWREDGLVPGVIKIGRRTFIERDVLCQWLENQMTTEQTPNTSP